MIGAIYIGIILVARVIQNYYNKKASFVFPVTSRGRMRYLASMLAISAVLAGVFCLFDGSGGNFSSIAAVCAGVSGFALSGVMLCTTLAMQTGTVVLSTVCGTAGLIVPCIAGIFLFGEPVAWPVWICIAVFLVAAYMLAGSAKDVNPEFSWKTVLLLFFTFLLNGVTMICQKAVTYLDPDSSISLFSLVTFAVPAVLLALMSGAGAGKEREKLQKPIILPLILLAVALFVINQLATEATKTVPSAVLFTLINGGNVVIAAAVAAICFGEKLTLRSVLGLVLGTGSLILINIFQ